MNTFLRLKTTTTSLAAALVIVGTITTVAAPVLAQAADIPSTRQVLVGGVLFLTVRDAWGGLTAEQRAAAVQERINQALSSGPIHASDITVAKVDGDWIVLLQGKRLFTADYDTAKIDGTAPKDLAEQWAAFLQKALPTLTYPTNSSTPPAAATAPVPTSASPAQ